MKTTSPSFQVIGTLGLRKFFIEQETAYALCILLNFNYFVSITLFFWYLGPWLRNRVGTANTLRVWEYYVSCAWLGQTIAFWVGRAERRESFYHSV